MTKREEVCIEAESWLGTSYHPGGRVKGAGCDCGTLLVEVLLNCGLLNRVEVDRELKVLGPFPSDWFHHTDTEKYFLALLRYAKKTMEGRCNYPAHVKKGSVVLTKVRGSRLWNHGGICVEWPMIIHCVVPQVCRVNAAKDHMWMNQPLVVFDAFGDEC